MSPASRRTFRNFQVGHALIACLLTLLVAGCRDEKPATIEAQSVHAKDASLTRSEAERLIRAKYSFPSNSDESVMVLSFSGRCFNAAIAPCNSSMLETEPDVVALQNLGLITVTFDGETSQLAFTDKGRRYQLKEPVSHQVMFGSTPSEALEALVLASTVDFGAVTGIVQSEGSSSARVEYTLVTQPTPFGEHPVPSYNTRYVAQTVSKTANLTRYDDGWRITSAD